MQSYLSHISGAVFIVVAALIALALVRALTEPAGPPRPVAKPFMTEREREMFRALEEALPMFRVHAQVAMGALLDAPRRPGQRRSPADRNAFSQKIVDFVIFDHSAGQVIALVELDDRTHRADRDAKRDAMTANARYMTIRIPGSSKPTIQTALRVTAPLRGVGDELPTGNL